MTTLRHILAFTLLFWQSCGPVSRTAVTEDQASYRNYERSEVRDVRFIPLGEGASVEIFFEPLIRGNVSYSVERIICREIYDFRENRLVIDKAAFPLKIYIKFYADFYEGTGPGDRRTGELEMELKEERNWQVKIYI